MKLERATIIVSKLPHRLTIEDLTIEEAHELWAFLSTDDRLSMTRQAVKVQLAKECGVFIEQLDAVANGATLTEVLVWESSDSAGGTLTLDNITSMFRNIQSLDEDWVVNLCRSMNTHEAELVWRWGLNERLLLIKQRMRKWAVINSSISDGGTPIETLIDIAFNKIKGEVIINLPPFARLQRWLGSSEPENWWFVPNCATLLHLSKGVVRSRNGDVNTEYTPQMGDIEPCWSWVNQLQTKRHHTVNTEVPFSVYQEPMTLSWNESISLLNKYPKGAFIIFNDGTYHILTSGSIKLYAQALTVRKIKNIGYEFVIGFKDGMEVVDTCSFRMKELPFELQTSLKRKQLSLHNSHSLMDIPDGLVLSLVYTWSPSEDWHLRYDGTHDNMGVSDIDQVVDYHMLVGEDNE